MKPRPVFVIALQAKPGTDGIRTLRAALKTLGRRYGLRCVDIREANTNHGSHLKRRKAA